MNTFLSKLDQVYYYFDHLLTSVNEHGIHPPFVFDFYCDLIKDNKYYYDFEALNQMSYDLFNNKQYLDIIDFGAGSSINKSKRRLVKDIARSVSKPEFVSQFFYRLVNKFQPKTIVELGTSLGITTCYLAMPHSQNKVFTFEGCKNTLDFAITQNSLFKSLTNITPIEGNFDSSLPIFLNRIDSIDLVYFDGNHRFEPTLRYLELFLAKSTTTTILIFDDIYWSKEMVKTWNEIKKHPSIITCVDLFYFGVVFLDSNRPKQFFKLRF